jgi:CBS domain-containing protein
LSESKDIDLSKPVGRLMRPTLTVHQEDSLGVAAEQLIENSAPLVPIVANERMIGVITEGSLARALAEGHHHRDPVTVALVEAPKIVPYQSGAEALRTFAETGAEVLVVVDDQNHPAGILLPSDLLRLRGSYVRPPLIGGMATPFGVYLTTGGIGAGVPAFAVVTTGMTMMLMFVAGGLLSSWFFDIPSIVGSMVWLEKNHVPTSLLVGIENAVPLLFFMLIMRLIPLSGTHAAEHKVVHAIERGEDLTLETVRRMPRVHPRCGTNLAVGLSLLMGLLTADFVAVMQALRLPGEAIAIVHSLQPILAIIAALFLRQPLGSFFQYWVTTKEPTDKQVLGGIESGKKLLRAYQMSANVNPTTGQRILHSGMLHVMLGSAIMLGVAYAFAKLFHAEALLQLGIL